MSDITLDKLSEKLDLILEKLETKEEEVIIKEDTPTIIKHATEDRDENSDSEDNVNEE